MTGQPPSIFITSGGVYPNRHEYYLKAVSEAGGDGRMITPDDGIDMISSQCDGLLIPGGRDLDPLTYGERPLEGAGLDLEERSRTDFEYSLVREIIRRKKPVFGICYGMQLLNVVLGGNLFQDIGMQIRGAKDHREGTHIISVKSNPYIGPGDYEVNSSHHQAVSRPGIGVRFFACSEDGVAEGLYLEADHYYLGIQCHPERMDDRFSKAIFRSFVEACRAYR